MNRRDRERQAAGVALFSMAVIVILAAGPEHGVNGVTIIGAMLGVAGLATMYKDL
jgi:hypothetical protein